MEFYTSLKIPAIMGQNSTLNNICQALQNIGFNQEELRTLPIDEISREFEKNGRTVDLEGSLSASKDRNTPSEFSSSPVNNFRIFNRKKVGKFKPLVTNTEEFHCVFCANNKEPDAVIKSHNVRDKYGKVLCPKLRIYVCPICGVDGDNAHTAKYCPQKPVITMEDTIRMHLSPRRRN